MMRSICLLPPACEHRASCAHPLAIRAPCRAPQVMAKKLADYYKKKGVVLRVIDKYVAEIEMSDSGDVLQVGGCGQGGEGGRARWACRAYCAGCAAPVVCCVHAFELGRWACHGLPC